MDTKSKAAIKFWGKVGLVAISGPIFQTIQMQDGVTSLLDSHLGNLGKLALLLTGAFKIAKFNSTGWLWLGTYCYYSAFKHPGTVAWIYLGFAIATILTHKRWQKKP